MQTPSFQVLAGLYLYLFLSKHSHPIHADIFLFSAAASDSRRIKPVRGCHVTNATDINGDGNTDLFGQVLYKMADSDQADLNIFLMGDGNGEFVLNAQSDTNDPNVINPIWGVTFPAGFNPPLSASPFFVDFNRDSYPDTLYIDEGTYLQGQGCPTEQSGSVNVYLGDGKGDFTLTALGPKSIP